MNEKKILLVDDKTDIGRVFEKALVRAGYVVRSAASGGEALEILKGEKIQVMFFDLNMPEMDGLELCRRVRKDFPMAMIHAVTGYSSLFPDPSSSASSKSVDRNTLLSAIAKAERSMLAMAKTP